VTRAILAVVLVLTTGSTGAHGQAKRPASAEDQTLNLSAYAELLRSDVRAQKVAILTQVMGFTEAEDAKFWPIYRECEAEMSTLGDKRLELVREYAANFSSLTDDVASKLASSALQLESERDAAKARCYEKVKAALSPRTALRFLQVEHQLQLLIDLQIAAALPVAPPEGKEQP
jgi:hypothetical protein